MRERRYIVKPGWLRSAHDDNLHYIGAPELMRLYGVTPDECLVVQSNLREIFGDKFDPKLIILEPRADGNYTL